MQVNITPHTEKAVTGAIGAILVICLAGWTFLEHLPPLPPTKAEIYDANIVKLSALGGHGTGVYISPTYILTNCHVAEAADAFIVSRQSTQLEDRAVPVGACSTEFDLGILETLLPNTDFIPLDVGEAASGQEIHSAGWGFGYYSTKQSIATGFESFTGSLRWHTSMSVNPGDSGSPIFNQDNKLVGLITAVFGYDSRTAGGGVVRDPFTNSGLATPSQNIKAFLKKWRESRDQSS